MNGEEHLSFLSPDREGDGERASGSVQKEQLARDTSCPPSSWPTEMKEAVHQLFALRYCPMIQDPDPHRAEVCEGRTVIFVL